MPAPRALTTGSEGALLVCILFISSCLFYYLYLKQIMKQKTSGKIFSIWLLFLATYRTGLKCSCSCLFICLHPEAANEGKDVVDVTSERSCNCQGKKGSGASLGDALQDRINFIWQLIFASIPGGFWAFLRKRALETLRQNSTASIDGAASAARSRRQLGSL